MDLFFNERREQSRVKTDIVVKYLAAWARIMVDRPPNYKAAFLDLFAGAGRYADGEPSTPVRVLELIIGNEKLSKRVVTNFNEMRKITYDQLVESIAAVPGINSLAYKPNLSNVEVGEAVATSLAAQKLVPCLLFADPYGYKGLTLDLIRSILKDWGSECIFFFNFNRIYMGLNHRSIAHHVDAIFGKDRADRLRAAVNAEPRPDMPAREAIVLSALREALSEIDGSYTLAFRFLRSPSKTSHYLIFVTKDPLGHKIMKDVMASKSSSKPQGVASFDFVLPDPKRTMALQLASPLDDLKTNLLNIYPGKSKSVQEIYDEHSLGTPYTMPNYKEALKQLRTQGLVNCTRRSGAVIRNNTMPDDVVVVFP